MIKYWKYNGVTVFLEVNLLFFLIMHGYTHWIKN